MFEIFKLFISTISVRYSQEDPNLNGNVGHSTLHPFSVKHSSIASNNVQLTGSVSTAYPQYQAPPVQFSPGSSSAGVGANSGAIFAAKDSQLSPAGSGHDFLYVNGSGGISSSDLIDGGMGDNAIFLTRKVAGSSASGHSLKALTSPLGVAGSRVSPPSELSMFAMAATSPQGPVVGSSGGGGNSGGVGVSATNFSSSNLSTLSNNLTSPLGFSPSQSSSLSQYSSYSSQSSSKQLSTSSSSSSASSLSSVQIQNTYQNTAPPPAAFSLGGSSSNPLGVGASGANPLKYRTTSGAQSGVQGYHHPKYSAGIKPDPPARTSSSLSSHQTAVAAAATGVNSSAAGSQ